QRRTAADILAIAEDRGVNLHREEAAAADDAADQSDPAERRVADAEHRVEALDRERRIGLDFVVAGFLEALGGGDDLVGGAELGHQVLHGASPPTRLTGARS